MPVEIFDTIILAFTVWPTIRPPMGVDIPMNEVRSHSLVCRRWAQRCRYCGLGSLALDSRSVFEAFLHLIDTAYDMGDIPSLAECIQELDIIHTGPWAVPGFHHILRELRARDIVLEADRITLEIRDAYVPSREGRRP